MSASTLPPHGTTARHVAGCRCRACRDAKAAYERRRRRQRAYGRPAFVDAAPVRDHVRALGRAGIGWMRVAELAGVSQPSVQRLLYGKPAAGIPPKRMVRPATAAAILAVRPDALADGATVPAAGTVRRLQALAARGWPLPTLARRLGQHHQSVRRLLGATSVRVRTARLVSDLYDQLWDQPPPHDTPEQQGASTRIRRYAAARGWAVPMAWPDDDLDNPDARPDHGHGRPGNARQRVEQVAALAAAGWHPDAIAAEVGCSRRTVHRLRGRVAS